MKDEELKTKPNPDTDEDWTRYEEKGKEIDGKEIR